MKRIALFLFLLVSLKSSANNVVLSNISIINNGPGDIMVEFDLSWENSWRVVTGPANYDGVWVFFKYRAANGNWTHITLTGNDNVAPAGVSIYQTNDFLKAGAIIYRSSAGLGNMSISNIRLGVNNGLPYNIDVRGFAVEMVYIPAPTVRPFFGDGDGVNESQNAFHYTDNTATTGSVVPMEVDNNAYDDVELEDDGIYVYSNDTIQTTVPLGDLDPFPTMKALWCMKYEISQAAYRDFLNTLTYAQQDNRTATAPNSATGTFALDVAGTRRTFLEIATPGVSPGTPAVYGCDANNNNIYDEAGDGEYVSCGFLLWTDIAAFLDWAGLAPMSEIHYERICRGVSSAGANPATFGEFAWGTNTIHSATYTFSNSGEPNEIITNASAIEGNAMYGSTTPPNGGPSRNGIFATGSSNRLTSGGSFYGVMDLSGNLAEHVITIGNEAGRSVRFIPNGNGTLSVNGNAMLSLGGAGFWPGMEGNNTVSVANFCAGGCEVTGFAGIFLRGGGFLDAASVLAIAHRGNFTPTVRANSRGGRGVLYIR